MSLKTMLITPAPAVPSQGGRAMLSRLLHDCLVACVDEVTVVRLPPATLSKAKALAGYIDGATPASVAALADQVVTNGIARVVIDGSNLGRIVAGIKRAAPDVQVLTFCHNVEARFFIGAAKQRPTPHALGVLVANYVAERLAVRRSDRLIALSERDSTGFHHLYGRRASDVFPMAMHDQLGAPPADADRLVAADAPALFVGGAFYANQQGIAWFAEHVAPHIGIPTVVVGRGMEAMRDRLENGGNVRVLGGVDDLSACYADARIVIAPIFDGSGMKTKVAEALMFGKRVVGTPEAFSGYDIPADQVGWRCATAAEFIAAIAAARAMPLARCDAQLRDIYLRDYSFEAAKRRMAAILAS